MEELPKERKSKDATTDALLGFFNTPAGTTALNGVQEQVTQTASITLYAGTTIIVSWVFRRILSDIVDMVLKGLELKAALEKK